MKTFDVYHKLEPDFMGSEEKYDSSLYEKVAVVECDKLSEVFGLTNHRDWAWYENSEVVWSSHNPRSTSVGDVIFDRTDGNGMPIMISNIGLKTLK